MYFKYNKSIKYFLISLTILYKYKKQVNKLRGTINSKNLFVYSLIIFIIWWLFICEIEKKINIDQSIQTTITVVEKKEH